MQRKWESAMMIASLKKPKGEQLWKLLTALSDDLIVINLWNINACSQMHCCSQNGKTLGSETL